MVCQQAVLRDHFHYLSQMHPPGNLQIRRHKGNCQFVHATMDAKKPGKWNRRGITRDEELLRAFALGQYGRTGLEIVEQNQKLIESIADQLIDISPSLIIQKLPNNYRKLPERYYRHAHPCDNHTGRNSDTSMIDRSFMRKWADSPYQMSDFKAEGRNKETSRGLKVRSKSEVLLCEKFYEHDIPFRYEQELNIGKYKLAPDFSMLNSKGNEFYVEYCGLMDDPDYVDHFLWKRRLYPASYHVKSRTCDRVTETSFSPVYDRIR